MIYLAALGIFGIVGLSAYLIAQYGSGMNAAFENDPQPGIFSWQTALLSSCIFGLLLAGDKVTVTMLFFYAAVAGVFLTCTITDVRNGLVPDIVVLPALAFALFYALLKHDISAGVGAILVFLPFALFAFQSKGLGLGWGDVKLATFAGAALGAEKAMLGSMLAFFALTIFAVATKRRDQPIAFAPYLSCAFAVVTLLSP